MVLEGSFTVLLIFFGHFKYVFRLYYKKNRLIRVLNLFKFAQAQISWIVEIIYFLLILILLEAAGDDSLSHLKLCEDGCCHHCPKVKQSEIRCSVQQLNSRTKHRFIWSWYKRNLQGLFYLFKCGKKSGSTSWHLVCLSSFTKLNPKARLCLFFIFSTY